MEKLVILDYENAEVHIFDIDPEFGSERLDVQEVYDKLGINSDFCECMYDNIEITYHKELINETNNKQC